LTRFNSLMSPAGFQWELLLFCGLFQLGGIIWYYASECCSVRQSQPSKHFYYGRCGCDHYRVWGVNKRHMMPVQLIFCMIDFPASKKMKRIKKSWSEHHVVCNDVPGKRHMISKLIFLSW
jgi:hypothetical protein